PARAQISSLSLHDALPISVLHARARADAVPALLLGRRGVGVPVRKRGAGEPRTALRHRDLVSLLAALAAAGAGRRHAPGAVRVRDRKSTRLNSSHVKISYA